MQAFYKLFLCCALSFYCRCPSPWGWRQEDAEFLGRTWHGVGTVKVFQDMSVTRRRKSGQKQGGRRKVTGLCIHCRFESIATYNLRLAEYTVDICRHWNAVDHLDLNDIVDSTLKSRMWNVKISLKLRLLTWRFKTVFPGNAGWCTMLAAWCRSQCQRHPTTERRSDQGWSYVASYRFLNLVWQASWCWRIASTYPSLSIFIEINVHN